MKVEFYTEDDFHAFYHGETKMCSAAQAAEKANRKIEREARRVYGVMSHDSAQDFSECTRPFTHTGLLIAIENVQPCQHEPGKVKPIIVMYEGLPRNRYECECGAKVTPSQYSEVK